ncbi:MAG: hypothetical protein A3K19_19025 [Lentisphaerae bacterium RIFOXYB12_FULL_65_16]|nr:MAG: hypothetical protein A3K18_28295 [Lentisphaerae bacterium RIFOXYA12_64_32]OGV86866.1 MAG: hypothetical protein A3K19_19025 [Lentisphaerae bacterium RIFOXYB12_FULL_65_16]
MHELRISVRDLAGLSTRRPVTGGVPIAEGTAPAGAAFRLTDPDGHDVPLQTAVLARWNDGSARWVLLDFLAAPPTGGQADYTLTWSAESAPVTASFAPVALRAQDGGLLNISDRLDALLLLTDESGQVCRGVVESQEAEAAGPLRWTTQFRGAFRDPTGKRVFQFRFRASAFAGLSLIRLEPLILVDADAGVVQRIRELKLLLRPRTPQSAARLGGDPGWTGTPANPVRLFQVDDRQYRIDGAAGKGSKAPGWAELTDAQGPVAVALRDFWQQWPKSLETGPDGLAIGLFPAFHEGDFSHMEPWYKYQYMFHGNCYQLRTGQARRWDLWLDLAGNGADLARLADAPLVPAADPAQAIATGVWDAIAPAGTPETAEYDPWAEGLFKAYCDSITALRDYGAMNWGDWFGERIVNWGNHEYDTTNQLLIQFARTGDPRYFHIAEAAGHHSAEVDTVHCVNADLAAYFTTNWPVKGFHPRPGMVHEHTVGHVSGFYSIETIHSLFIETQVSPGIARPYLCLDPFNLGHIWTQGTARLYFLTGDPFVRETVLRIGDNLAQLVEDNEFDFMINDPHSGRAIGWPLLALAGAYEIDLNPRHLNAMKALAERILPRQDPNCGGWLYSLYPGHCWCKTHKHVGMAGFITSILVNGLSRYQVLAGHDGLPQAIDRAVTFLNNDTWHEEWQDWRYTSCPATPKMGQPGVTIMALVNAVRIADNPEHLRILRLAWKAKFKRLMAEPSQAGMGKTYSATMYGCAEAAGLLSTRAKRAPARKRSPHQKR